MSLIRLEGERCENSLASDFDNDEGEKLLVRYHSGKTIVIGCRQCNCASPFGVVSTGYSCCSSLYLRSSLRSLRVSVVSLTGSLFCVAIQLWIYYLSKRGNIKEVLQFLLSCQAILSQ